MLFTLISFFLALLILVIFHEYGHFLVARWCGVKVLRFSFGFGPVLARWQGKKGTEYVWSLLPLGGYVKMLDETEGEVPKNEQHLAFNRQPLWKRVSIVIAGPLFNFIFAIVALWLVAIIGVKALAPIVEYVKPNSIAAQAGLKEQDEIIALDGVPIRSWRDVQYAFMPHIGSEHTVRLTVKSLDNGTKKTIKVPLNDWRLNTKKPDLLNSLGIKPFIPTIPPVIGKVVKDTPAARSELKANDLILEVNEKEINDWLQLVQFVKENPGKRIELKLEREGRIKIIPITIGSKVEDEKMVGFVGLLSKKVDWPEDWLRVHKASPLKAVPLALKQTWHLTSATITLLGRLVTGQLSIKNISGPVGIAQGAGESARGGLVYYLSFLALVSISLGVLNLLPIPMLDGGHLLFYAIEAVIRRPLSDEFKSVGIYIGLLLLVALMIFALMNDISRLS